MNHLGKLFMISFFSLAVLLAVAGALRMQPKAVPALMPEKAQANNFVHVDNNCVSRAGVICTVPDNVDIQNLYASSGPVYMKRQEPYPQPQVPGFAILTPQVPDVTQGVTPLQDPDGNARIYIGPDGTPVVVQTLPRIELTLADAVDIMAEYELIHETRVMNLMQKSGLTDAYSKTIIVNNSSDNAYNRDTVLHEWLHVKYKRLGIDTGGPYEPQIAQRAHEIYLQLYGQQN